MHIPLPLDTQHVTTQQSLTALPPTDDLTLGGAVNEESIMLP